MLRISKRHFIQKDRILSPFDAVEVRSKSKRRKERERERQAAASAAKYCTRNGMKWRRWMMAKTTIRLYRCERRAINSSLNRRNELKWNLFKECLRDSSEYLLAHLLHAIPPLYTSALRFSNAIFHVLRMTE